MTEQLKECSGIVKRCRQVSGVLKEIIVRLTETEETAGRAENYAARLRVDLDNLRTDLLHLGYRMNDLERHVRTMEDDKK